MDDAIRASQGGHPQRVLVADGDPNVRAALRLLLARHPQFRVVADSHDLPSLLASVVALEPDLILLDLTLPGLEPGHSLARLRRLRPAMALIALSTREEQRQCALAAGCAAFVGKGDPPAYLLAALGAASREHTQRAALCGGSPADQQTS